jgi:hypothetical protein
MPNGQSLQHGADSAVTSEPISRVAVRLVRDTYNPLIVPVAETHNRNAPHTCHVPEWVLLEWEAVWERVKLVQAVLRAHYDASLDDTGGL